MRRPRRPVRQAAVLPVSISLGNEHDPAKITRALESVGRTVERLAAGVDVVEVDLFVGTNNVRHGLGRTPRACYVTPRYADASFAWSYDWAQPDNPQPDRVAQVTVVGADMPCRVVFV